MKLLTLIITIVLASFMLAGCTIDPHCRTYNSCPYTAYPYSDFTDPPYIDHHYVPPYYYYQEARYYHDYYRNRGNCGTCGTCGTCGCCGVYATYPH